MACLFNAGFHQFRQKMELKIPFDLPAPADILCGQSNNGSKNNLIRKAIST